MVLTVKRKSVNGQRNSPSISGRSEEGERGFPQPLASHLVEKERYASKGGRIDLRGGRGGIGGDGVAIHYKPEGKKRGGDIVGGVPVASQGPVRTQKVKKGKKLSAPIEKNRTTCR